MITLLDINKAINDKIKLALVKTEFNKVSILAEDISEPIIRPSLKVGIENSTNGKFNASCREKSLTIRIYFFTKDRYKYKIDNAKMQDIIENAFIDDLEVSEGFFIPINGVNSVVTDTVLICSFDLYTIELLPNDEISEPMETLEIEL
ncbi:MAG: hypothetical protein RR891_02750 [Clostridium sp.]